MRMSICGRLMLAGVCMLAGATAWAQQGTGMAKADPLSADLAVTYATERAQIAPGTCGCFWFEGGGADAAVTFWKGIGAAAVLTGDHASNFAPGLDVSKVAFTAGPRYTYTIRAHDADPASRPRFQVFAEALFGGVHAFNSAFPSSTGLSTSAGSFALETGGGINIFFSNRFAVRLLEVDYVRTELPNNYFNAQNDLRLGFGITWHARSLRHFRR
jgi:outer membrane immunogenic protein